MADLFGDYDVEHEFLGACLSDPSVVEDSTLTGEDFENPHIGRIFERCRERARLGLGVSQALLSEDFPDHVSFIWGTTDSLYTVSRAQWNEDAIHNRSRRRRLKMAAQRIVGIAEGNESENLVDRARMELDSIESGGRRVVSMVEDVREVLAKHREDVRLVPSPWDGLNKTIGGFGAGRMYVFGARPGVGKSALAAQAAYTLARDGAVVFATMEMDKGEVYSRIIAQQASIYHGGLKADSPEYMRAQEESWLADQVRDIRVVDDGTQSVASIRSVVRSVNRETPVVGVIVDYIHLLTTPDSKQNEVARIADITRGLKQLAMDFKVPVIALSQLNRNVSGRIDPKPTLADLRGSGSIEQDADVVVFLYRDTEVVDPFNQTVNVYVGKNRQGASFVDFELEWQPEFVRAVDGRQ